MPEVGRAEVEKLGPGLWVLPVPIPDNPLGWTSVHLLESGTGPHLVLVSPA